MSPGELTLRLEQSIVPLNVSHIEGCPDLGPACAGPTPPTPYWHHVDELVSESAFDASYALTENFAVDTRWAVRIVDIDPSYAELDGAPKSVPNDIHHHDETIGGLTDPWLLLRVVATAGHFATVGRLGLSFPIGKTVPNPYELSAAGKWHEHVQVGSGTFIPIVELGVAYTIAPVTISASGTGLLNFYASSKGYQAPARYYLDHRVSVGLFHDLLTPFAEALLLHEGEEYWDGVVGGEGSNIRTEIYVGGGLAWRFTDPWTLEGGASARVASLTDAPTFSSPGTFSLALSATFDLAAAASRAPGGGTRIAPHVIERRHDGIVEYEKD
jgi:hypothetical protein